jgi:D-alanyl-D-alanine carboxypeptidase (penicillin-binding protein 5/6)
VKAIALVITLALHASGLWPHITDHARGELTATAAEPVLASPSPAAASLTALPVLISHTTPGLEAASSVIAIDRATATVLYSQDPGHKRPIASVTKLVTAMTILSRHSLGEAVTVGQLPAYQTADERLGLAAGETYKLGDLIKAALIPSANDAADALAIYDSGSVSKFTAVMNRQVNEWGIADSHFSSASGLQDSDNYSTALAMSKLAALALANPTIKQLVAEPSATITSSAGRSFSLKTTNDLLSSGRFYGIKTGYTPQAGECFIGLTKVNGHEVITVVLGSSDRFGETQALVNWIGSNWQWL